MITYKKGNLIQAFENGEVDVIAHITNCESPYVSGIAQVIFDKYPKFAKRHFNNIAVEHVRCMILGTTLSSDTGKEDVSKYIFNLYAQYYRGEPSNKTYGNNVPDSFEQRLINLEQCLKELKGYLNDDTKLGLPLLSSGIGACKTRKKGLTDLEYFVKYIAPTVENCLKDFNVTVYYL